MTFNFFSGEVFINTISSYLITNIQSSGDLTCSTITNPACQSSTDGAFASSYWQVSNRFPIGSFQGFYPQGTLNRIQIQSFDLLRHNFFHDPHILQDEFQEPLLSRPDCSQFRGVLGF